MSTLDSPLPFNSCVLLGRIKYPLPYSSFTFAQYKYRVKRKKIVKICQIVMVLKKRPNLKKCMIRGEITLMICMGGLPWQTFFRKEDHTMISYNETKT